jgi:hypothetical protein
LFSRHADRRKQLFVEDVEFVKDDPSDVRQRAWGALERSFTADGTAAMPKG